MTRQVVYIEKIGEENNCYNLTHYLNLGYKVIFAIPILKFYNGVASTSEIRYILEVPEDVA